MDKGLLKHLMGRRELWRVALILALGLFLIIIGSGSEDDTEESEIGIEERLAEVCTDVDGVGECYVLVYYSPIKSRADEASVESVIVVCEGADSTDVRLRLTEMISSFFGIGTNRVRVEKMRG